MAGKNILVRKNLSLFKTYGAAFRAFLADTLGAMGYLPIYADLVLWLRPAVKLDGFEYYEYILFYVGNVLCISHNPRKSMKRVHEYFNLKPHLII